MKVNLVGLQDFNFKTREGEVIDGVKLHYLIPEENTYGFQAEKIYIARNVFKSFKVDIEELIHCIGCDIDIEFNNKRKVCGIDLLKAS